MKTSITKNSIHRILIAAFAVTLTATAHAGSDLPPAIPVVVKALTESLAVSAQVTPEQIVKLKAAGVTAIVSLRPDGEAPAQPTAAQVGDAARSHGISFSYVPVASGAIPAKIFENQLFATPRPKPYYESPQRH